MAFSTKFEIVDASGEGWKSIRDNADKGRRELVNGFREAEAEAKKSLERMGLFGHQSSMASDAAFKKSKPFDSGAGGDIDADALRRNMKFATFNKEILNASKSLGEFTDKAKFLAQMNLLPRGTEMFAVRLGMIADKMPAVIVGLGAAAIAAKSWQMAMEAGTRAGIEEWRELQQSVENFNQSWQRAADVAATNSLYRQMAQGLSEFNNEAASLTEEAAGGFSKLRGAVVMLGRDLGMVNKEWANSFIHARGAEVEANKIEAERARLQREQVANLAVIEAAESRIRKAAQAREVGKLGTRADVDEQMRIVSDQINQVGQTPGETEEKKAARRARLGEELNALASRKVQIQELENRNAERGQQVQRDRAAEERQALLAEISDRETLERMARTEIGLMNDGLRSVKDREAAERRLIEIEQRRSQLLKEQAEIKQILKRADEVSRDAARKEQIDSIKDLQTLQELIDRKRKEAQDARYDAQEQKRMAESVVMLEQRKLELIREQAEAKKQLQEDEEKAWQDQYRRQQEAARAEQERKRDMARQVGQQGGNDVVRNLFMSQDPKRLRALYAQRQVQERQLELQQSNPNMSAKDRAAELQRTRREAFKDFNKGQADPAELAQVQGKLAQDQISQMRSRGQLDSTTAETLGELANSFAETKAEQDALRQQVESIQKFLNTTRRNGRGRSGSGGGF